MELNWKILPTVFDETGCLRWSSLELATCSYSLHFIDSPGIYFYFSSF